MANAFKEVYASGYGVGSLPLSLSLLLPRVPCGFRWLLWAPCGSFGPPWALFGFFWFPSGAPFGLLWLSLVFFGFLLASLWLSFWFLLVSFVFFGFLLPLAPSGSRGFPVVACGSPWSPVVSVGSLWLPLWFPLLWFLPCRRFPEMLPPTFGCNGLCASIHRGLVTPYVRVCVRLL